MYDKITFQDKDYPALLFTFNKMNFEIFKLFVDEVHSPATKLMEGAFDSDGCGIFSNEEFRRRRKQITAIIKPSLLTHIYYMICMDFSFKNKNSNGAMQEWSDDNFSLDDMKEYKEHFSPELLSKVGPYNFYTNIEKWDFVDVKINFKRWSMVENYGHNLSEAIERRQRYIATEFTMAESYHQWVKNPLFDEKKVNLILTEVYKGDTILTILPMWVYDLFLKIYSEFK